MCFVVVLGSKCNEVVCHSTLEAYITPKIAYLWRTVALELGMPNHEIQNIQQVTDPASACCLEVFSRWLRRQVIATWADVCDALKEAGYIAFACDLKHALLKSDLSQLKHV